MSGPVPEVLEAEGTVVTIGRAWPHDGRTEAGERRITLEGADAAGRIRAARLTLDGDGAGGAAKLELVPPGRDRKLAALERAAGSGVLVSHRLGKRAVVRAVDRFVKVVRAGAEEQVAERAETGRRLAGAAGLAAPQVLAVEPGRVDTATLPGRPLHHLAAVTGHTQWERWWKAWAQAWPELVTQDAGDLPVHDGAREADTLRQWADRAVAFGALPAGLLPCYLDEVARTEHDLRTGLAQPLVVAHRDLHDKQLLAHAGGLGLLDFDTAARAEPALDLANLLVHVHLRADQGIWSARAALIAEQQVRAVVAALGVDEHRLTVHVESTRLRLAALYAFRPRHRELALRWAGA